MTSGSVTNGGTPILVLYKVINSDSDPEDGLYNAFHMPRGNALTLAAVKHHCTALRHLSHMGPDGFHWRVCVSENIPGASSKTSTYTWWDIQDENARLPVKESTTAELQRMFMPRKSPHSSSGNSDPATKAAKGAFKMMGKAISGAVDGHHGHEDHGPRLSVIAFKLLDMVKMHDDFSRKHGGTSVGHAPPPAPKAAAPRPAATPAARVPRPANRTSAPPPRAHSQPQSRQPVRQSAPPRSGAVPRPPPPAPPEEASLMDFGTPDKPAGGKSPSLRRLDSSPASFKDANNETRAQRLKREYAKNQMKQNRVWDEVDQRWVAVESNEGTVKKGSTSAPPSAASTPKSKTMGISLESSSAHGKAAHVQAAVNQRVNDMKASQQKALAEVREREEKKKQEEAEEDAVRKRLEPKIKAWSEEHGKKKQLRALLASLHTILWPEANWKPVSIGDILDDSKCKRCYHKASRVVHPDKTHHLSAENRFLAKRIFDALSQAKTELDNQS